jgi:DNA modification methylase
MVGDSTKIEDVEKLMNGQKADMVFTDPPYGVSYQSNMRTESDKFDVLKNDEEVLTDWIVPATTFSTGWFLFCTSWKVLPKWFDVGKNIDVVNGLTNMIIWDKGGGGIGDLEHSLSTDYEMILAYNRGNKIVGKRLGSVWSIGKDGSMNYAHPTQKPVELPAQAIQTLSTGSVLDLFGGSGSTLIACEQLNRTCYMMELDPKYVDVIRKRYAKFIGKEEEWQTITPKI